jgi:hypothetical protein
LLICISLLFVFYRKDAKSAERKFLCLVAETPTRQNFSTLRVKNTFRIFNRFNDVTKIEVKEFGLIYGRYLPQADCWV